MNHQSIPVLITEEDYQLLKTLVGPPQAEANEMSLAHEVGRAIIVRKDAFPKSAIRLNSAVTVADVDTGRTMAFKIVMPHHADIKAQKVSVLTPMGTALIGFRKGVEVRWKVPAGWKTFRIVDVDNTPAKRTVPFEA
jgi:regulator of nucleoside diphosphate kinase